MASSSITKSNCATCSKATGIFTCCGCTRDFCTRHAMEHRQTLGEQMDEVILEHDQLRQKFIECMTDPRNHPLVLHVNEWERISIDKIRQVVDDARKQLLNVGNHTNTVTDALGVLTQDLSKAREEDDFVETDLKRWLEKLDKLKKDFSAPDTIKILEENDATPFISKITISELMSTDIFNQSLGSTRIEDNGRAIVHGQANIHGSIRGKGEYTSGQHRFRFKFEQFISSKWAFFGIIPKTCSMKDSSWNTPNVYGWTTNWNVTCNGVQNTTAIACRGDINTNDVFELVIDCDRRTIRLTHERTNITHELNIDITLCPFPWQLILGLHDSVGDRIRIL